MIRTSCAWARTSSRRTQTAHAYLRNLNNSVGNTPGWAPQRTTPSYILKRHNASEPPIRQEVSGPATTIPGPSWLWLEPVIEPFRAYGRVQQRKPYLTQLVSSLVIYFFGDLVAQSIAAPPPDKDAVQGLEGFEGSEEESERGWLQQWSEDRDWARTGRALAIGGLSSIPSYKWFLWLGNNFNYSSKILSLTTKVVVNQLLFTPIFNSYFFGMQTLLTGATFDEIVERIKHTVPTSWINSCKLWPVVTAFSFTYIPIQYRSIFGGVIAIGWQTYLSLLNQSAAAQEHHEHPASQEMTTEVATTTKHKTVEEQGQRGQEKQKCVA